MPLNYTPGLAKALGALLGICAGMWLLIVSVPAASAPQAASGLRLAIAQSGVISARPAAPRSALLARSLIESGPPAHGGVTLRNSGPTALYVRLVPASVPRAAASIIQIRIGTPRTLLANTTLAGLRIGQGQALRIRRGAQVHLQLSAQIPPRAGYDSVAGRRFQITLEPQASAHP